MRVGKYMLNIWMEVKYPAAICAILALLPSCSEEQKPVEIETIEVSLAGSLNQLPTNVIMKPLPFVLASDIPPSQMQETIVQNLKSQGYKVSIENNSMLYEGKSDGKSHFVVDRKAYVTIVGDKSTRGDFKVRKERVSATLIYGAYGRGYWQSEIVIDNDPDLSDEYSTDIFGNKSTSVFQLDKLAKDSEYSLGEVNSILNEMKFSPVSSLGERDFVEKCVSPDFDEIEDKNCSGGIRLKVFYGRQIISAEYADNTAAVHYWKQAEPKLKAASVAKFGEPTP